MSGKLFQKSEHKAQPIRTEIAPYVQYNIIKELLDKNPGLEFLPIGSVGKKKDGEYNGDIDIAVKCDSINKLYYIIYYTFDYLEITKSSSLYIVSINYPYQDDISNEIKYVAVDFILMHDEEYTKFRYYCPNYKENESNYKVGAKIMFTNTILNHCFDELNKGLKSNSETHEVAQFEYSPIGLYRIISTVKNDNLSMLNWRQEFVTINSDEIAGYVFKDANKSHFNSIETLWKAIHSDNFKYPNEVRALERSLFVNSYRKCWEEQIKPENFIFTYWTLNDIYKEFDIYKKERNINKKLDKIYEKLS